MVLCRIGAAELEMGYPKRLNVLPAFDLDIVLGIAIKDSLRFGEAGRIISPVLLRPSVIS